MSALSETARAAEWYAKNGIPIFPVHVAIHGKCSCGKQCASPGKHPRTEHGHQDATTDPEQIRAWWGRWPDAGIGMPTGHVSGLLAVDIDPRHGGDATFEALILKHGRHADTAEAVTGGGGRHVIFRHPAGTRSGTLGPGIDLKAEGGYILIAPSLHPSGKRYVWDGIEGGKALLHPADPPAWLLPANGNGKGPAAPVPEKIPHGLQQYTLTSFAGRMRNAGADYPEIRAALLEMNRTRCEKPGAEKNIEQIARSICNYPPGKVYTGPEEPTSRPASEPAEPPKKKDPARRDPRIVTLDELAQMKLPKPKFVIENVITKPGAWSLVGSHKSGKTLFACQMGLSYHAGVPFLDNYRTLESRGCLFIEQDDPAGLATVWDLVDRSPIPKDRRKFFSVENAAFTIGPKLVQFLEREIRERDLGLIVLDSYTKMRSTRGGGVDIVKAEAADFGLLDELAKATGTLILILHHRSHGNAGLDWSDQAAGTYAIGASTEGEIHISRFRELPSTAPERLIQIRGRRMEGLEAVIRLRPASLDYEFVLEGAAAPLFPELFLLSRAFGSRPFSPKDMSHEMGLARSWAHKLIGRLVAAGAVRKEGYGEYVVCERI